MEPFQASYLTHLTKSNNLVFRSQIRLFGRKHVGWLLITHVHLQRYPRTRVKWLMSDLPCEVQPSSAAKGCDPRCPSGTFLTCKLKWFLGGLPEGGAVSLLSPPSFCFSFFPGLLFLFPSSSCEGLHMGTVQARVKTQSSAKQARSLSWSSDRGVMCALIWRNAPVS